MSLSSYGSKRVWNDLERLTAKYGTLFTIVELTPNPSVSLTHTHTNAFHIEHILTNTRKQMMMTLHAFKAYLPSTIDLYMLYVRINPSLFSL